MREVFESTSPTDVELVQNYVESRSEEDFRLLYRTHSPYLYRLALRLLGGRQVEAEDALQEAWVRAAGRIHDFHWRSTLRTWLGGFVINCCRELRRKREPTGSGVERSGPISEESSIAGRIDLERLLEALPDGQREVLVLFHVEGLTHEEIAARLAIAPGTSKSRLFQARRSLQQWADAEDSNAGEPS
jgi:RNA polymerase sigma-70 factor (ECF subfamily)